MDGIGEGGAGLKTCTACKQGRQVLQRDVFRVFRLLVSFVSVAVILPSLLLGYPAAPLLIPENHSMMVRKKEFLLRSLLAIF
jgi:hypothetical protein